MNDRLPAFQIFRLLCNGFFRNLSVVFSTS